MLLREASQRRSAAGLPPTATDYELCPQQHAVFFEKLSLATQRQTNQLANGLTNQPRHPILHSPMAGRPPESQPSCTCCEGKNRLKRGTTTHQQRPAHYLPTPATVSMGYPPDTTPTARSKQHFNNASLHYCHAANNDGNDKDKHNVHQQRGFGTALGVPGDRAIQQKLHVEVRGGWFLFTTN